MEAFSGVLVCCTNLLKNLDGAVLRRFAFKVAFQPLTEEGPHRPLRAVLPLGLDDCEARTRLAALSMLTPGDFKAVLSRVRFNAGMGVESLVDELEVECSYKKSAPAIGFRA